MKTIKNGEIINSSTDAVVNQLSVLTGKKASLVREIDDLKVIRVDRQVYLYKNGILGIYDSVSAFKEGLAVVKKEGLYGYINMEGNIVIDLQYKRAKQFSNDRAVVGNGTSVGIIDKNGKIVVPIMNKSIKEYKYDYAVLEGMFSGDYDIIDKDYNVVLSVQGTILTFVNKDKQFIVRDRYGSLKLMDIEGKSTPITHTEYEEISEHLFSE